jgi:ElaB/YqjD/DUF883 family membrane-anchored ribosome-binding protein
VAEERDQVVPPVRSPVATPLAASELDDEDVPRSVSTAGLGPGGSADRIDVVASPGTTATAGTGAAATTDSDDPDVIREQIERTREEMSQTINQLQERLSPERLAHQAKDTVREATVGRVQQVFESAGDTASQVARRAQDAAEPVMEQVRERPVPVALLGAGAGLAWWMMRRASSRQTWSNDDMYNWDDDTMGNRNASTRTRSYATGERQYADRSQSGWQSEGGWMQVVRDNPLPASIAAASLYMLWSRRSSAAGDHYVGSRPPYSGASADERYRASARRPGDTGQNMGQQALEKASELGHMASEKASELGDQVSDTMRTARQRADQLTRQTSTQFDHWMRENPLAVGVAAMAAGAVMGLTVPGTRAENRALGASRDALVERATDSAMQLKEQVRDKVQEVAGDLANSTSNTGAQDPSTSSSPPTAGV